MARGGDRVDEKTKEQALRQVVYGLVVVGSRAGEELNGMTANWITQVSFDPPMIAVAIEQEAHTRQLIDAGQIFSVNMLPVQGGQELAQVFVKPQKRVQNKLGDVAFHEGPATGTPILDDAIGAVECKVVSSQPVGSHVLYIGEVVGAETPQKGDPLILASLGWHYAG